MRRGNASVTTWRPPVPISRCRKKRIRLLRQCCCATSLTASGSSPRPHRRLTSSIRRRRESWPRCRCRWRRRLIASPSTARRAFAGWRQTPAGDRVQPLFQLKMLLETHLDEIARSITDGMRQDTGRKRGRAAPRRSRMSRWLAASPSMMQGWLQRGHRAGHRRIHDPPAASASSPPSRRSIFPAMIPFWFLPYAIACGNCFILKPSERVPITMQQAVSS